MSDREPPLEESRARELLSRERERIEASLEAQERIHTGEVEGIKTAVEAAEDAELIEEEQVDDALAETLREELAAVERALARLEEGSYGFSVESGEPIPAGRLEAIPWAERTAGEEEHRRRTQR
jgi:RNA polymerase-binding transcription factor